jgi:hypothetical protein
MTGEVSYGTWKVADVMGASVQKGMTVELVLDPDGGLALRGGGATSVAVPWSAALVRVDSDSSIVVYTDGGRVWLHSAGGRSDGLAEAVRARRAAADPDGAGDGGGRVSGTRTNSTPSGSVGCGIAITLVGLPIAAYGLYLFRDSARGEMAGLERFPGLLLLALGAMLVLAGAVLAFAAARISRM